MPDIRTSYSVHYSGDRPCDVVYSTDAIRRVARDTPILRVVKRHTAWFGNHDDLTRGFRVLSERVMSDHEY